MDLDSGPELALRAALEPGVALVQTAVVGLADKPGLEVRLPVDTAVVAADLQQLHPARSNCRRPARLARLP